jgi:hypothetical protein
VQYSQVDSEGEPVAAAGLQSLVLTSPYEHANTAAQQSQLYIKDRSYPCSYDARNPYHVWWGSKSSDGWLITMIIAWGIIALFLCGIGFGYFFSKPIET